MLSFVCFNFGHVQLLMFIVVVSWSYLFGHVSIPYFEECQLFNHKMQILKKCKFFLEMEYNSN